MSESASERVLLTAAEHLLVRDLGRIAGQFLEIMGDDISRSGDYHEAVFHIHGLQNMVLANAAARAYPESYRALGEVIKRGQDQIKGAMAPGYYALGAAVEGGLADECGGPFDTKGEAEQVIEKFAATSNDRRVYWWVFIGDSGNVQQRPKD